MIDWINALNTIQKVFAVFAGVGSLLFVSRMVMMFIGFDGDSDGDGLDGDMDAGDGNIDADADADHSGDTDISFQLLSFQGLTAFFMMSAWSAWP